MTIIKFIKFNINDSELNARMNTGRRKKIFNKFKDKFDKLLDLKILYSEIFFLLCAVEGRQNCLLEKYGKNFENFSY